jgi:hypothetical protein
MRTFVLLLTVAVLVGCAFVVDAQTVVVPGPAPTVVVPGAPAPTVVAPSPTAAAKGKYSGVAWTWDSARNIVTLNDAGRQFRVLVTPDQIARLNHHQQVTVTGTLLGPDPIETVLIPTQPMTALVSGPAATAEITGQIASIDANGVATVESTRGPLRVWLAENPQARFQQGRPVKLAVSVQPVRMVAVSGAGGQASVPTMTPVAPMGGDSATVVGRIMSVSPTGTLTVESPRGPVNVWVPDAASFRVGDFVQVQTIVQSQG